MIELPRLFRSFFGLVAPGYFKGLFLLGFGSGAHNVGLLQFMSFFRGRYEGFYLFPFRPWFSRSTTLASLSSL